MTNYAKPRIANPSRFFETPNSVLEDVNLNYQEKKKILMSMAADAEQMIKAAAEGMEGASQGFNAKDLQAALQKLKELRGSKSKDDSDPQSARFQRIVVVTSANQKLNREIANVAYDLAEIAQGHVTLLSVVPAVIEGAGLATAAPMFSAVPLAATDNTQIMKDRNDMLSELRAESGDRAETDIEVRSGQIEEVIVEHADDQNADVIVVGSPNRSWLEALFNSSTANTVTRSAQCPVLVVPEPA